MTLIDSIIRHAKPRAARNKRFWQIKPAPLVTSTVVASCHHDYSYLQISTLLRIVESIMAAEEFSHFRCLSGCGLLNPNVSQIRMMIAQDFVLYGIFVKKWCSYSYTRRNKFSIRNKRPARACVNLWNIRVNLLEKFTALCASAIINRTNTL